MEDGASICCPTVVFRRAALLEAGPFDATYPLAADYDMWFRLALRHDVAYLAEPLFRYREHPASLTGTHRAGASNVERIAAKRAALERAEAARAFPAESIARWRSYVGREAVRFARRYAIESPEQVLGYLASARSLAPGTLVSATALTALLRLPYGWILRKLGIQAPARVPKSRRRLLLDGGK
jgi:hypothetical protein